VSSEHEFESDNSDHSESDIEDPLPQVVFNLWVIKEGSSKMLPGFKQECLDLNTTDYAGLKARLDELVLQKLGVKLRDSKTVSIMYGANWVSGAKAVNTTKPTPPSHYGDLSCVADFDGLRERIRGSLGGQRKSSSNHVLQLLATTKPTTEGARVPPMDEDAAAECEVDGDHVPTGRQV
jgi:hypothetical protein